MGGRERPQRGRRAEATGASAGVPDDPEAAARKILLRQLEASPKSRAQLAAALAERNVDSELAERLLRRFTEVGLIDDSAYASAWVESRSRSKGLSRRAIRTELQRKGIAREVQEEALAELSDEAECNAALAFARSKARSLRGLEPLQAKRRLAGALGRRGYASAVSYQVAGQVVAECFADQAEAELVDFGLG